MANIGLGFHLPLEAQAKYQNHINKVPGSLGTQATIAFTQLNDAARLAASAPEAAKANLQKGMASFNQLMALASTPDSRGIPQLANPDVSQVVGALQISIKAVHDKLAITQVSSAMPSQAGSGKTLLIVAALVGVGAAVWWFKLRKQTSLKLPLLVTK